MRIKPFRHLWILSFIILFAVSGCDSRFQTKDQLSEYVSDLNRSQLIAIIEPEPRFPAMYPAQRQRWQELSEFDIGLLDFLSLQQCDVGAVAGQRNSILGKVMPPSQRFLYEVDIIRAIESCPINDDELQRKLLKVALQKRQELTTALANAVFNDSGREALFSLSNGYLPLDYSTAHNQALLSALQRLLVIAEQLERLPTIDKTQFEQDLKTLTDSEYIGRLVYSVAQVTEYLTVITAQLEQVGSAQCGAPIHYLATQFEENYVRKIQPYMARINRTAYQILPVFEKLAQMTAPHTGALDEYLMSISLQARTGVWFTYQQASAAHAQAWSRLLAACGEKIGGQS